MIGRVARNVWRFIRWLVLWWRDDVLYMLRAISKAPRRPRRRPGLGDGFSGGRRL